MKGAVIAGIVAFLVFAAAGTGVGVMRAKTAVPADSQAVALVADSAVAADSASLVPHHADAVGDEAATPSASPSPMPVDLQVGSAAASAASEVAAPAATVAAAPPRQVAEDSAALRTGRIAKLFVAMSPREAAKVLQQMQDHDVLAILGALPERRGGEILALMAPERSASLAKAMLARSPEAK